MSGFNPDDYVDVAERIQLFYAKYPEGRLVTRVAAQPFPVGERTFVWCQAAAYRTPDDAQPAIGTAWEPIPGPTPFTRDSELMNAETAAWGRAIISAGIPSKKIASADEVRARTDAPAPPAPAAESLTDPQMRNIHALIGKLEKGGAQHPDKYDDWETFTKAYIVAEFGRESRKDLSKVEAGSVIEWLKSHEDAMKAAAAPFS